MSAAFTSLNKIRIFKHIQWKPRWSQVLLLRRTGSASLVLCVQWGKGGCSHLRHEGIKMAVSENANGGLAPRAGGLPPEEIIFGRSTAMISIRQKVQKVLATDVPILIQGENGTGKGLLAQYIHSRSALCSGAFVKVNCAAIPGTLLERELFGYEKGAFTGANNVKPGRVELAHRGTLFLDEIADLDLNLQSKLLHFLQDGTFSRIGDQCEREVDTGLICATNKDLEAETNAGRFRQDLYYRIHVFRLKMPALRERRDDVPLLAEYFRKQFERQFEMKAEAFPTEMLEHLKNLAWAGNIRELANVVAR